MTVEQEDSKTAQPVIVKEREACFLSSRVVHTLVASSNRGRFALDNAQHGRDLICGDVISVQKGKSWVSGHVEHTQKTGYYLDVDGGVSFQLRAGMRVRLPDSNNYNDAA